MKQIEEILFTNTKLDGTAIVETINKADIYGDFCTLIDYSLTTENEQIYLIAIGFECEDCESEILVSKSCFTCLEFIDSLIKLTSVNRVSVFEFEDYRDAYETAIAIKGSNGTELKL